MQTPRPSQRPVYEANFVRADAASGQAVRACRSCGECRVPLARRARSLSRAGAGRGAACDPLRSWRGSVRLADGVARRGCPGCAAGAAEGAAGPVGGAGEAARCGARLGGAGDLRGPCGSCGLVVAGLWVAWLGLERVGPCKEAEAEARAWRRRAEPTATASSGTAATRSSTGSAGRAAARAAGPTASGLRWHPARLGQRRPKALAHGATRAGSQEEPQARE